MNKSIYIFINQIPPRITNVRINPGAYEAFRLDSEDVSVSLNNIDILLLKKEEGEYWTELIKPEKQS